MLPVPLVKDSAEKGSLKVVRLVFIEYDGLGRVHRPLRCFFSCSTNASLPERYFWINGSLKLGTPSACAHASISSVLLDAIFLDLDSVTQCEAGESRKIEVKFK
jgi:hypothetical protein